MIAQRTQGGKEGVLILGISALYHDAAACLIRGPRIVAAAQEERFTRVKHDPSFPINAIRYCLAEGGVTPEELTHVPELVVSSSSGSYHSRMGKNRCDPEKAFRRWTDILVKTAKAMGTRVIVTAPTRNLLNGVENGNNSRHSKEPVDVALARLDDTYRRLLRCSLSESCSLSAVLAPMLAAARRVVVHPNGPGDRPAEDDAGETSQNAPREDGRSGPQGIQESIATDLSEQAARAGAWRDSAKRFGAEYIDFEAALRTVIPTGLMTGLPFVDEVHLSPQGYWFLASLWTRKIAKSLGDAKAGSETPSQISGQTKKRYHQALAKRGESFGQTVMSNVVGYLARKMALFAAPVLKWAAQQHEIAAAQLTLGWLRAKVGLESGLPAALESRIGKLDFAKLRGQVTRLRSP